MAPGPGPSSSRLTLLAFLSFLGLALVQSWPLPLCLATHLTGPPGGDAGVYIWNTWIFRHELLDHGRSPFSTTSVLALDGPANLAQHNYTVFADLLALPLQPWLGVVLSFNVVYLINVALCGLGMFVLARRLTGTTAESWIAGALFACAPFLIARGTSHFSLAAAAPLPFFLYWLDRAWASGRLRDGVAAGAMVAWAAFSDPYYAVYCLMLTAVFVGHQVLTISRRGPRPGRAIGRVLTDLAVATLTVAVIVVHVIAGGTLQVGSFSIGMRSLYTPMLLLTTLAGVRLFLQVRPQVALQPIAWRSARVLFVMAGAAALMMAPELYAILSQALDGRLVSAGVLWRSSAPGVDLAAFLVPNPHHPLAPDAIVDWLARQPGQFDENVVSLSWIGTATIIVAWRLAAFRPNGMWATVTLGFASLAVGPFLTVAGVHTLIPTPWTFLRYLPLIGEARMPQRFGIVAFLGFTLIVTTALIALCQRVPQYRRRLLLAVGAGLAIELLPVPRALYAARIPSVYGTIAADPRPVSIIELPFGIRDGLSAIGDFSAASAFYQTLHEKPLLGGYLSRIEDQTKDAYRRQPFLGALMTFSEGRVPTDAELSEAVASAPVLARSARIGYVVIDVGRTTIEFQRFAIESLGLVRLEADGPIELYAVR